MNSLRVQLVSAKARLGLGLVLLFLTAFALRIYRLDAVDLRGDEAYTVLLWTVTPFSKAWMELARNEPHPVGAFLLYWSWTGLVGQSVFAVRLLSVFGNLLGMAAFIAVARRIFKRWPLVIALAFLWLLNPFFLWHAQDARTYSVLSGLSPLCFYLFLRLTDQKGTAFRQWIPYIVIQTLLLYLHYFEVLWLVAQGIYLLSLRDAALLRRAVKAWGVIGLLAIPVSIQAYYLVFVSKFQSTIVEADWRLLFSDFLPTLLFGDNTISLTPGVLLTALIFGCLAAVSIKQNNPHLRLVFFWGIIPPLLLYLISKGTNPNFIPRYMITITPALLLAIMAGIDGLSWPKIRPYLMMGVTLALSSISLHEINDYFYNDSLKSPDWQNLAAYLESRTTPQDVIISGAADPALDYYYNGVADLYNVPISDSNPTDEFAWLTEQYSGIYLLASERTSFAETYLREHTQVIYGDTYPGVVQYRDWDVPPTEIEHPLAIQFGDVAILRGYTVLDGVGGSVIILLYWEAIRQTATQHSVLVHVVTEVSEPGPPPVAVLDHGIANAIISTTAWQPGGLYRDPIIVPVNDIPAGKYTLRIGLYETDSGTKLPIDDPSIPTAETDYQGRYPIGAITLR